MMHKDPEPKSLTNTIGSGQGQIYMHSRGVAALTKNEKNSDYDQFFTIYVLIQ